MAARLAKAKIPIKGDRKTSLFRIHRDVRFANNKDPYKTNAGAAMTRTGSKNDPAFSISICRPRSAFSPPASTSRSRRRWASCARPRPGRPRPSRR